MLFFNFLCLFYLMVLINSHTISKSINNNEKSNVLLDEINNFAYHDTPSRERNSYHYNDKRNDNRKETTKSNDRAMVKNRTDHNIDTTLTNQAEKDVKTEAEGLEDFTETPAPNNGIWGLFHKKLKHMLKSKEKQPQKSPKKRRTPQNPNKQPHDDIDIDAVLSDFDTSKKIANQKNLEDLLKELKEKAFIRTDDIQTNHTAEPITKSMDEETGVMNTLRAMNIDENFDEVTETPVITNNDTVVIDSISAPHYVKTRTVQEDLHSMRKTLQNQFNEEVKTSYSYFKKKLVPQFHKEVKQTKSWLKKKLCPNTNSNETAKVRQKPKTQRPHHQTHNAITFEGFNSSDMKFTEDGNSNITSNIRKVPKRMAWYYKMGHQKGKSQEIPKRELINVRMDKSNTNNITNIEQDGNEYAVTQENEFEVLALLEQLLLKSHEDNVMKMFSSFEIPTTKREKRKAVFKLNKRNSETLADLSLKESMKKETDGEGMPDDVQDIEVNSGSSKLSEIIQKKSDDKDTFEDFPHKLGLRVRLDRNCTADKSSKTSNEKTLEDMQRFDSSLISSQGTGINYSKDQTIENDSNEKMLIDLQNIHVDSLRPSKQSDRSNDKDQSIKDESDEDKMPVDLQNIQEESFGSSGRLERNSENTDVETTGERTPEDEATFEVPMSKEAFSNYINTYKRYLKSANGLREIDNDMKRQAYKLNIDNVRNLLNNIFEFKRKKRFFDDTETEDQDISTKSDESWFKKHFYLFLDNGPPKKYHTSQIVALKSPSGSTDQPVVINSKHKKSKNQEPYFQDESNADALDSKTVDIDEWMRSFGKQESTDAMSPYYERSQDIRKTTASVVANKSKKDSGAHGPFAPLYIIEKMLRHRIARYNESAMNENFLEDSATALDAESEVSEMNLEPPEPNLETLENDMYARKPYISSPEIEKEADRIKRSSKKRRTPGKSATPTYNFGDSISANEKNKNNGYVDVNLVSKARDKPKGKMRNLFKKFSFHKKKKKKKEDEQGKKEKRELPRKQRFSPLKIIKDIFKTPEPNTNSLDKSYEIWEAKIKAFKGKDEKLPSLDEMKKMIPNITIDRPHKVDTNTIVSDMSNEQEFDATVSYPKPTEDLSPVDTTIPQSNLTPQTKEPFFKVTIQNSDDEITADTLPSIVFSNSPIWSYMKKTTKSNEPIKMSKYITFARNEEEQPFAKSFFSVTTIKSPTAFFLREFAKTDFMSHKVVPENPEMRLTNIMRNPTADEINNFLFRTSVLENSPRTERTFDISTPIYTRRNDDNDIELLYKQNSAVDISETEWPTPLHHDEVTLEPPNILKMKEEVMRMKAFVESVDDDVQPTLGFHKTAKPKGKSLNNHGVFMTNVMTPSSSRNIHRNSTHKLVTGKQVKASEFVDNFNKIYMMKVPWTQSGQTSKHSTMKLIPAQEIYQKSHQKQSNHKPRANDDQQLNILTTLNYVARKANNTNITKTLTTLKPQHKEKDPKAVNIPRKTTKHKLKEHPATYTIMTSAPPKQSYMTAIPMRMNDFEEFLKENGMDVESVTSPLFELQTHKLHPSKKVPKNLTKSAYTNDKAFIASTAKIKEATKISQGSNYKARDIFPTKVFARHQMQHSTIIDRNLARNHNSHLFYEHGNRDNEIGGIRKVIDSYDYGEYLFKNEPPQKLVKSTRDPAQYYFITKPRKQVTYKKSSNVLDLDLDQFFQIEPQNEPITENIFKFSDQNDDAEILYRFDNVSQPKTTRRDIDVVNNIDYEKSAELPTSPVHKYAYTKEPYKSQDLYALTAMKTLTKIKTETPKTGDAEIGTFSSYNLVSKPQKKFGLKRSFDTIKRSVNFADNYSIDDPIQMPDDRSEMTLISLDESDNLNYLKEPQDDLRGFSVESKFKTKKTKKPFIKTTITKPSFHTNMRLNEFSLKMSQANDDKAQRLMPIHNNLLYRTKGSETMTEESDVTTEKNLKFSHLFSFDQHSKDTKPLARNTVSAAEAVPNFGQKLQKLDKLHHPPKRVLISSHSLQYDIMYDDPELDKHGSYGTYLRSKLPFGKSEKGSKYFISHHRNSELTATTTIAINPEAKPTSDDIRIDLPTYYNPDNSSPVYLKDYIPTASWRNQILKYITSMSLSQGNHKSNKQPTKLKTLEVTDDTDTKINDATDLFKVDDTGNEQILAVTVLNPNNKAKRALPKSTPLTTMTSAEQIIGSIVYDLKHTLGTSFPESEQKPTTKRRFCLVEYLKKKLLGEHKTTATPSFNDIFVPTEIPMISQEHTAARAARMDDKQEADSDLSYYDLDYIQDASESLTAGTNDIPISSKPPVTVLMVTAAPDLGANYTSPLINQVLKDIAPDLNKLLENATATIKETKIAKRDAPGPQVFTAKNVAALEVVVDMMKNSLEENILNSTPRLAVQDTTVAENNEKTNAIQVHIAIPYLSEGDKKRQADLTKIRKVFSAKMNTPVDLEYQINSFEDRTKATTEKYAGKVEFISPGMYILVSNPKSNGKLVLKPVERNVGIRAVQTTPMTSKLVTSPSQNLARVTLSKDFVAAINKELMNLVDSATANSNDSVHNIKARHAKCKDGKVKHNSTSSKIWNNIKRFFGHDRVCNCHLKPNQTMCRTCAACDAVMSELLFEFDNMAKFMSDHCTEIQTFFWMNPTGGRKLRETVHNIDKSLQDYYKRVKGKCRGPTCQTFSTYIDKRQNRDVMQDKRQYRDLKKEIDKDHMLEVLNNDLNVLSYHLNNAVRFNVIDRNIQKKAEEFVKTASKCLVQKRIDKRDNSKATSKRYVYSVDNINVNIICQADPTDSLAETSTVFVGLNYDDDEIKTKKKHKGFKNIFRRRKVEATTDQETVKKRETKMQIESPLIADAGGSFWHDYLIKGTTIKFINNYLKRKTKMDTATPKSLSMTSKPITTPKHESSEDKSDEDTNFTAKVKMALDKYLQKKTKTTENSTKTDDYLSYNLKVLSNLFDNLPQGREVKSWITPKIAVYKREDETTTTKKVSRSQLFGSWKKTNPKTKQMKATKTTKATKKSTEATTKSVKATTKTVKATTKAVKATTKPKSTNQHKQSSQRTSKLVTVTKPSTNKFFSKLKGITHNVLHYLDRYKNKENKNIKSTSSEQMLFEMLTFEPSEDSTFTSDNDDLRKERTPADFEDKDYETTTNSLLLVIEDPNENIHLIPMDNTLSSAVTDDIEDQISLPDKKFTSLLLAILKHEKNRLKKEWKWFVQKADKTSKEDKLRPQKFDISDLTNHTSVIQNQELKELNGIQQLKEVTPIQQLIEYQNTNTESSKIWDKRTQPTLKKKQHKFPFLFKSKMSNESSVEQNPQAGTESHLKAELDKIVEKRVALMSRRTKKKSKVQGQTIHPTMKQSVSSSRLPTTGVSLSQSTTSQSVTNRPQQLLTSSSISIENRLDLTAALHVDVSVTEIKGGNRNTPTEVCDPTTASDCICDLHATYEHIQEYYRALSAIEFEKFAKNVTCHHYMTTPKFYVIRLKQKKTRKIQPNGLDSVSPQTAVKWDWIRNKRSMDYNGWKKSDDDDNDIDGYDSLASYHIDLFDGVDDNAKTLKLNDAFDDVTTAAETTEVYDVFKEIKVVEKGRDGEFHIEEFEDHFDKYYKGVDGIYKTREGKRKKRTAMDMKELVLGLKNLPPLRPALNELYAILGDNVVIDCVPADSIHVPKKCRSSKRRARPISWISDRSELLKYDNVRVEGPRVFIKNAETKNIGNYTCTKGSLVRRTVRLTVITLPQFNVVFIPMYTTDKECTYEDLKSLQQLGPVISKEGRKCRKHNAVRIDEPICMKDKIDGATHFRAIAILSTCPLTKVECSPQCRRDLQCSLALLSASNVPGLSSVPVLLSKDGYNKSLVPSVKNHKELLVTHTLRKKDLNGHVEYHKLASKMYPGNIDIVVSCPAGYFLMPKQKICVACPLNTFAGEGDNECTACPSGTRAPPAAPRCRLALIRPRRYDWCPPSGGAYYVAGGAVVCACAVCVAFALAPRVTSRGKDAPPARTHRDVISVGRVESRWGWGRTEIVAATANKSGRLCQAAPAHSRVLTPSRVILARFFRGSRSSSRVTDSQGTKFEQWKEKNRPPPLPPIDFD